MTLPSRLVALCLASALFLTVSQARADDPPSAKLVVLVYFDQFRGDYLERWNKQFGEGGFKRLMADGAWFPDCHYPYACTVTAAGHASVATGCSPADHGIVGNDWYERSIGSSVNCVGSDRHEQVPLRTKEGTDADEKKGAKGGVSPDRLLKPTIADALKLGTDGKGKVVALSLKNRGATLPGGKTPDAVYWMDGGTGLFVTSTFYRDSIHTWVADFNKSKPAEQWRGKTWERLRSDIDYAKLSGPDDVVGESRGTSTQGRVFPHPFESSDPKVKSAYLGAVYSSPFGNELLLDLAEKAIDSEKLGADAIPDLLSLSFSSNDAVGHAWGPDSQEVLDVTLRSDRVMKRLLDVLDTKVGKGKYVLVMTADHGVCPLPEVSRETGAGCRPGATGGVGRHRSVPHREIRQAGRQVDSVPVLSVDLPELESNEVAGLEDGRCGDSPGRLAGQARRSENHVHEDRIVLRCGEDQRDTADGTAILPPGSLRGGVRSSEAVLPGFGGAGHGHDARQPLGVRHPRSARGLRWWRRSHGSQGTGDPVGRGSDPGDRRRSQGPERIRHAGAGRLVPR